MAESIDDVRNRFIEKREIIRSRFRRPKTLSRMDEKLEVFVGGEALEGWKDLTISRAFDRFAGSFSLGIADLEPDDPSSRKLRRGDKVTLKLDGEIVLTGRIKTRTKAYTGTTNSITLAGTDVVSDLIDCSAVNAPGQWRGGRIASIARELILPFEGLRFREDLSDPTLGSADLALNTGESVFDALDRLARMRGLVVASDLAGGVYFARPGNKRAPVALERGTNIEGGTIVENEKDRFSPYLINGQAPSVEWWKAGASPGQSFRAFSIDPGVKRNRPLLIQAEAAAGFSDLQTRVDFEASVRAARATRVSYTLPGWKLDGYLWQPGELVGVFDPILEIGGAANSPRDMLVGSVEWSRSATGGSRTKLELYQAGAFSTLPVKPPAPSGENWWE